MFWVGSIYKWVLVCSSIQDHRNGGLICFNDYTKQCGPFLTSPAWMVVWMWVVCFVSPGTLLRQLHKTWIEMINTTKMQLIDFRCQGLSHKTWKIYILRKILSWQQMLVILPFVPLFAFPFADDTRACLSLNWIQKESEVGSGPVGLLLMTLFWCLQYPSWLCLSAPAVSKVSACVL